MTTTVETDQLCVNTIRFLSADGVQKANSGHPGMPMGMAASAYVLWTRFMKHNPSNPKWLDRDRFVLSAGHGSMLLYSMLHLTGYELSLEEIKNFRQWGSLTPGHPESHLTAGVETTTGPLGQGIANAVGMAIAEAHLAACYNRPGHGIIDHFTYVIAGDGDLMEGLASEASSLAGHLRLGKLIVLYDSNNISLSGSTSLCFSEDVTRRYAAYGWNVLHVKDGNDVHELDEAIDAARKSTDSPSLIVVKTHIGFGSPNKQDTYEAHGAPLGPEELKLAKENLGWPVEPAFHIPDEAKARFQSVRARGAELEQGWSAAWDKYQSAFPELAADLYRRAEGRFPDAWDAHLPSFAADPKGMATRKASETVMQVLARDLPELAGGAADLNPSTFTWLKNCGDFEHSSAFRKDAQGVIGGPWGYEGRNIHFGVRENAMGSIVNGLALHGAFIPFGSTFLVFSDYMRPAIRLSAIMKIAPVWVFTHDGIGVGEDGPTHQPVEHFMALRAIPGLQFIRPCDANETVWAWKAALMNRHRPTILALTRQNVPVLDRSVLAPAEGLLRGAYVLNPAEFAGMPDILLLATGSEVQLILEAGKLLAAKSVKARIVSMPCWELFREQPAEYIESVLPKEVTARVAVETGVTHGWHEWIGHRGAVVTLDRFGASAPGPRLMKEFGFTAENIVNKAIRLL